MPQFFFENGLVNMQFKVLEGLCDGYVVLHSGELVTQIHSLFVFLQGIQRAAPDAKAVLPEVGQRFFLLLIALAVLDGSIDGIPDP